MGGKAGPRPEGRHQEAEPGPHEGVGGGGAVRRVPQAPEVSRAIGEGACLTQNLRGGTLQGLLPNLLDGVEVHLGRLGQSCVEKGRRPAAAPPLCAPHPPFWRALLWSGECGGLWGGGGRGRGRLGRVCVGVCVCGEVVLAREAGVGAPPGRQDPVAGVQASMWVRRRVWAGVSGGAGVEAQSGGGMGSGR